MIWYFSDEEWLYHFDESFMIQLASRLRTGGLDYEERYDSQFDLPYQDVIDYIEELKGWRLLEDEEVESILFGNDGGHDLRTVDNQSIMKNTEHERILSQKFLVIRIKEGFQPCDANPDLLTETEAIQYLRLETINIKNPSDTLRYYREKGVLRGTQLSKGVWYLRKNLNEFLDTITNKNPR